MNTTTNNIKYQLSAREGREYLPDTGWEFADVIYATSDLFETKQAALDAKDAFISSLNVTERDVIEIELTTLTWDEGEDIENDDARSIEIETLDVIDMSEKLLGLEYVANQYFGQYMIAQDKWDIHYVPTYQSNLLYKTKN